MIGNRSLIENAECKTTMTAKPYTATASGITVSLDGSTASMFQVIVGNWTDGSHTIHLQHRDSTTDSWAGCSEEDLDGFDIDGVQRMDADPHTYTIDDATKNGVCVMIAYVGGKRFLRARSVESGATVGAVFSVIVWKLGLRFAGKNPMRPNWNTSNVA